MIFRKQIDPAGSQSKTFSEVFPEEIEVIRSARNKRQTPPRTRPVEEDLIGLTFSGGGIRSATFNLGVIQAFAKNHLLNSIDYLSTVSGGGYIGSWLSSWAYYVSKERGGDANHISLIEAELNRTARNLEDIPEPAQVFFLRKYSNYLTPHLGILSGDTLSFISTYARNLLLNQTILVSALLSLLLVPRAVGKTFDKFNSETSILVCGVACFLLLVAVFVKLLFNATPEKADSPRKVVRQIAIPLFVFCLLLAYLLWQLVFEGYVDRDLAPIDQVFIVVATAASYVFVWGLATALMPTRALPESERADFRSRSNTYLQWAPALWSAPAGVIGGFFLLGGIRLFQHWVDKDPNGGGWSYLVVYGVPLTAAIVLSVGAFHLGLIGRAYEDGLREWWARLGGVVLAFAVSWLLISLATLFVPTWLCRLWTFLRTPSTDWLKRLWKLLSGLGVTSLFSGWIAATVKGLLAAKSSRTGPRTEPNDSCNRPKLSADIAARIAPPIFAVGLSILLSLAVYLVVAPSTRWYKVILLSLALYSISRFFGFRVDVNEFSLHNAYRNRLVRCYLGATNVRRNPQPFTGFDENDNICLAWLQGLAAPFHILNATLNVVKGRELALQARKARSFAFTPLYSGFEYTGDSQASSGGSYRLSAESSLRSRYPGLRLGTAMAISGAAASPSMGHYTTGSVAFLMTIFSVRLGWWLGNPRKKKYWESGYPRSSWRAIVNELTGSTNDDQNEVYLSDGGHFENLGIYELIRRRCRVIIACDAGADPSCLCNDLASAIEKCRIDFGTNIVISLDEIRPKISLFPGDEGLRASHSPFAIGQIRYPNDRTGVLIYIKPSLNTELPQDVLAYARLARSFPHQSTIDQFFDEAQFESYRALGFSCASAAVADVNKALNA